MAKMNIPIEKRDWVIGTEFAEATGTTPGYVGEEIRAGNIKATKCGKTWRIPKTEINRKLGIEINEDSYKKELYIKDLESKIKEYEVKFNTMENLLKSAASVLDS